jgi:hypothetical protein
MLRVDVWKLIRFAMPILIRVVELLENLDAGGYGEAVQ